MSVTTESTEALSARARGKQTIPGIEGQARIEDHALIGDMYTAALVTKDCSIDWLCLPASTRTPVFTALLGIAEHGRWKIAPPSAIVVERRYPGRHAHPGDRLHLRRGDGAADRLRRRTRDARSSSARSSA